MTREIAAALHTASGLFGLYALAAGLHACHAPQAAPWPVALTTAGLLCWFGAARLDSPSVRMRTASTGRHQTPHLLPVAPTKADEPSGNRGGSRV